MKPTPALHTWTASAHPLAGGLRDFLPGRNPSGAWIQQGQGMVGFGVATSYEATGANRFSDLAHWWQAREVSGPGAANAVAFVSISFSASSESASQLSVPEVLIQVADDEATVTVATTAAEDPAVVLARHGLRWQPGAAGARGTIELDSGTDGAGFDAVRSAKRGAGTHPPEHYLRAVHAGVEAINEQRLEKLVLARDVVVRSSVPFTPGTVLHALSQQYPTCWTYRASDVLGATPEMLIRVRGDQITARVLAGTVDSSLTEDQAAKDLLEDPKQRREHDIAVASLVEQLAPIAEVHADPQPSVLALPNVYHLASDVSGQLNAAPGEGHLPHTAGTPLVVAERAHPTAAICGTPTSTAGEIIASLEEMDRGPYAGPVGWIDHHGNADFGIALRGGVLEDSAHAVRLFAGCGVVAGSVPEDELAESEAKLQPMLSALGVQD